MQERQRPEPPEAETPRLAGLPVDALPADAPDTPSAATDAPAADQGGNGPDPEDTAHDPTAERGPRALMDAYAAALAEGDARLAAELFAEQGLVSTGPAPASVSGREAIAAWHADLLGRGPVTAAPAGQGNDQGRLELSTPDGERVVELSFDASGRIGTARWLAPEQQRTAQDERQRTGL
jgi:SnoaL-like domain